MPKNTAVFFTVIYHIRKLDLMIVNEDNQLEIY